MGDNGKRLSGALLALTVAYANAAISAHAHYNCEKGTCCLSQAISE